MICVFRQADDGLSRERWEFDAEVRRGDLCIRLRGYGIERRKTARGRFSNAGPADRWASDDERSYTSGLLRPIDIPAVVTAEAVGQLRVRFYIGWFNEDHELPCVPPLPHARG